MERKCTATIVCGAPSGDSAGAYAARVPRRPKKAVSAAARASPEPTSIAPCTPWTNDTSAACCARAPATAPAWLPTTLPTSAPWPPITSWMSCAACACAPAGSAAILSFQELLASVAPIEPSTEMPSAPPTCRELLTTPDATPALVCSTAPIAADDTDGIVIEMPAPIST